jgi:hypothetical protein
MEEQRQRITKTASSASSAERQSRRRLRSSSLTILMTSYARRKSGAEVARLFEIHPSTVSRLIAAKRIQFSVKAAVSKGDL